MLRNFRFGLPALFAAMLLAISVGGWFKFHRDLYLEEQAILEALAEAGCDFYFLREIPLEDARKTPSAEDDSFWEEHLQRIRVLSVGGHPSPELRSRLEAMPEVEFLQILDSGVSSNGVPPMPTPREVLGAAAPELPEGQLDPASAAEPHPTGTALSEAETAELVDSVRKAWTDCRRPDRYVRIVEEQAFGHATVTLVDARDGNASLVFEDMTPQPFVNLGQMQIADGRESCILGRTDAGWKLMSRVSERMPERSHNQAPSIEDYIVPRFQHRPADLEYVVSAERLDRSRVRLTFRPHVRNLFGVPGPTLSVEERSLIVDGDLDWSPVSVREVHRTSMMPPGAPATRIAEESRFERIGGYVLPVEAVGEQFRTRVAWTIDPAFKPGTFSMNRYFDDPVPVRRDLPFWRWYRVGFAIGFGLIAVLVGRSFVGFVRQRPKRPEPAEDASVGPNNRARPKQGADDEREIAPTPGA